MNTFIARKKLSKLTNSEKFPVEEYQDKYYLSKKIKNLFPELTTEEIISAINFANKEIKTSGKKNKFINALSSRILIA